ncbi:MAG: paraquat-inducible protein A [Planctomycetota bacterium]
MTDAVRTITCRRCGKAYALPRPVPIGAGCPYCGAAPRSLRQRIKDTRSNGIAALLATAALLTLAAAVVLPFVTMDTLGNERTFSLLGSIAELFRRNDVVLALVLGVFSVVFPFAKLIALLAATSRFMALSDRGRRVLHKAAVLTGKYSLLDILVVAVMIVVVKVDGMAEVSARSGTVLFCIAVLLSIAAGFFVKLDRSTA